MTRAIVALGLTGWVGLTLLLSRVAWFSRSPLTDRLRPYTNGPAARRPTRLWSSSSFRELISPLGDAIGTRVARAVGVHEDLTLRLERVHSTMDTAAFRARQLGWATLGLGGGCVVSVAAHLSPLAALALCAIGPVLAFLIVEQKLANESEAWRQRLFLELPVVGEQLAILLSAGYSLGAALNRLSVRTSGSCAADLRRVCRRVRQGLSEAEALREWAAVAQVPALSRLVPLLALSTETSDLGRLVSDEVRHIRREVHRELIASVERRAQQVWIPVTVATLLPGVIFLAIPFAAALRQVTT